MRTPPPEDKLELNTPISRLPSIRPRNTHQFSRLGIHTVSDLIKHLPARYEHQSAEGSIADLPATAIGSTRGLVMATRTVPGRASGFRGQSKPRFEAELQDDTGRLSLVWFHATHLRSRIHPGLSIRVQGKTRTHRGQPQMVNPRWEPLDQPEQPPLQSACFRPVYPATEELPSQAIERAIRTELPRVLALIVDPLPQELLERDAMPPLAEAFRMAHQPHDRDQYQAARRRLAFNELLLLQLGIAIKRHYNRCILRAQPLRWSKAIDTHIRQRFPFRLTDSQNKVIRQITADLRRPYPMNRLLQGDVGSGKTVVALYALLLAVANRKQGAMMAPTELLAEQHHDSISRMLHGSGVKLALLTGSKTATKADQRRALLADIRSGRVDIVVGTQALLTETVRFKDLAVVVIDEQHRFGVLQRATFRNHRTEPDAHPATNTKTDPSPAVLPPASPHCLVMTATPIPRTLSLTVFGDLDLSVIQGLPPGRSPVTTRQVHPDQSDRVYRYVRQRLDRGEQAYVVVPTIDAPTGDPSADPATPSPTQLKNVREHARLLADRYFPSHTVATVHGRLKPQTRRSIMDRFRRGDIHVLVATTVIEVGVDVPNATVMVVEHAERFGLAQLHQLRGRIGRGDHGRSSLCIFIAEPATDEAAQRLKAITTTHDGFEIAEHDLTIRGLGEFFGTRQHGLRPLRVARIPQDVDLLQLAQREADHIVDTDPRLTQPQHLLLRKVLLQQYGDALSLIDVG